MSNRSIDSLNICFLASKFKMVGIKRLWIEKIYTIEIEIKFLFVVKSDAFSTIFGQNKINKTDTNTLTHL